MAYQGGAERPFGGGTRAGRVEPRPAGWHGVVERACSRLHDGGVRARAAGPLRLVQKLLEGALVRRVTDDVLPSHGRRAHARRSEAAGETRAGARQRVGRTPERGNGQRAAGRLLAAVAAAAATGVGGPPRED
eukprot:825282-Prymnesium_polylepis.1